MFVFLSVVVFNSLDLKSQEGCLKSEVDDNVHICTERLECVYDHERVKIE